MEAERRVGLCASCAHARPVVSSRGPSYWLCERSRRDRRYAKYPALPVLTCLGYEKVGEHGGPKR